MICSELISGENMRQTDLKKNATADIQGGCKCGKVKTWRSES